MTQHTPGPWHIAVVEPRTLGMKHQVRVYANAGMDCHVANCFGPNPDRVIDIDKIARANARLIAAAPDLLFAARAFMTALETMTSEDFSLGADKPFREQLSTAITKATEV